MYLEFPFFTAKILDSELSLSDDILEPWSDNINMSILSNIFSSYNSLKNISKNSITHFLSILWCNICLEFEKYIFRLDNAPL